MAGYKLFFVSAQGKFLICSTVHTNKHIMDVTLDDLYANYPRNCARKVVVLLRSECFASRGKACLGSREGNRRARQAHSVNVSSFLNS